MKKFLLATSTLVLSFAFSPGVFADYEMQLDAVAPGTAAGGATVRLTGRNFGASQAGHRVMLRHNSAVARAMTVTSWSNTQIAAVIPRDAMAGPSSIAILNPTGETGPVNASRHVPFTVMATLKPGVAAGVQPTPGFGKVPGAAPKGPIQLTCTVDPAAEPLRAIHVRKMANGTYVFWIQATIRNRGTTAYAGGPRQAGYVLRMGTRILEQRNFTTLAPGATFSGGKTIEGWRLSDEFPPDFTLEITYDPDIRIDSNTQNDDCRMTNNKQVLSGAEVLRVLRSVP